MRPHTPISLQIQFLPKITAVSYTHLDVYKRQVLGLIVIVAVVVDVGYNFFMIFAMFMYVFFAKIG